MNCGETLKINSSLLEAFFDQMGYLERLNDWKVLLAGVDTTCHPYLQYSWRADYEPRNSRGRMEIEDAGFFNPASTIKTAIAAATLEWLHEKDIPRSAVYRAEGGESFEIAEDLRVMQVISDNASTNRLLMLLGFDALDLRLKSKGITEFSIERLMLDGGTLVNSPAHEIIADGRRWHIPAQTTTRLSRCQEFPGRAGNGASMAALIGVMMRLVQPQDWGAQAWHLRPEDRQWLLTTMTKTPQQLGYDYPDHWNRFLQSRSRDLVGEHGRLISKCGVALWSKTWTDQSFMEGEDGRKLHAIIAVRPPEDVTQEVAFPWMANLTVDLMGWLNSYRQGLQVPARAPGELGKAVACTPSKS